MEINFSETFQTVALGLLSGEIISGIENHKSHDFFHILDITFKIFFFIYFISIKLFLWLSGVAFLKFSEHYNEETA